MSEIKYPCAMEHKHVAGLVVWFHKIGNGTVVQTGKNKNDKVGDNFFANYPENFKPYVRPPEYEYQVLFKSCEKHKFELSKYFFKNLHDWNIANQHLSEREATLLVATKREVK